MSLPKRAEALEARNYKVTIRNQKIIIPKTKTIMRQKNNFNQLAKASIFHLCSSFFAPMHFELVARV